LHQATSFLNTNPEIDAVATPFRYFRDGNEDLLFCDIKGGLSPWAESVWNQPGEILDKLLVFNFITVNSIIMRSCAVKKIGQFNEQLRALEDWEYWIRGACKGVRYKFEDTPLTKSLVRLHRSSMSHREDLMLQAEITMRRGITSLLTNKKAKNLNYEGLISAYARSGTKLSRRQKAVIYIELIGLTTSLKECIGKCLRTAARRISGYPHNSL
jgi:hypothetical protein